MLPTTQSSGQINRVPGQTEERFDIKVFGTQCIDLPNPMYGPWETTPDR